MREPSRNRRTVRRILRCIRPYGGLVALSLLLSVLTVALTLYVPILTGRGVDAIAGAGRVDFAALMAVIAGIVLSISVTALAQWVMNHINNKITFRIVRDLRTRAFDHLQQLPLSYVDRHSSGDLISRIITDIDQFSDGCCWALPSCSPAWPPSRAPSSSCCASIRGSRSSSSC